MICCAICWSHLTDSHLSLALMVDSTSCRASVSLVMISPPPSVEQPPLLQDAMPNSQCHSNGWRHTTEQMHA